MNAPRAAGTVSRAAVVTLWFVSAAEPKKILAAQPKADRGFGRKLLAQLNPAWPITPIGQFALNRSAKAAAHEFYIAGYPGVAVVQTWVENAAYLSELDQRLRSCLPAADVYAFTENTETGLGGFAHWVGGDLRRCFSARRERVYEDLGLPEPFEAPFWAGERAEATGGINLPFIPLELKEEAQREWLGFELEEFKDINVVGYAVDGRPEPKQVQPKKPTVTQLASEATSKLGLGAKSEYDDYERPDSDSSAEFRQLAAAASAAGRRLQREFFRLGEHAIQALRKKKN